LNQLSLADSLVRPHILNPLDHGHQAIQLGVRGIWSLARIADGFALPDRLMEPHELATSRPLLPARLRANEKIGRLVIG